jgi:hypothetical protein
MEEFNELNLDMDEAFTLRAQFGDHLGKLKDWIVMMGQLPPHIAELIDHKPTMESLTPTDFADVLENINENIVRGLEALTNLLQYAAVELYDEAFSNESFTIPELDIQLGVSSMEISMDQDLHEAFEKIPEQAREHALKALKDMLDNPHVPDELHKKICKFLEERGA